MPLRTDIDATYPDSPTRPGIKAHQEDHDALAEQHNAWEDVDPADLLAAIAAKQDAILPGAYGERTTTYTGAAIQTALTAKGTAGGGEVELVPNATYVCLLPLFVPSNVTLKLNGATIEPDPAAVLDYGTTAALVIMQGTTDVSVLGPGTIDTLGQAEVRGILTACDTTGTLIATRHTVRGVRVINTHKHPLRAVSPVVDLTWDDNQIEDCDQGMLVLAGPGLTPNKGVRITGNRLRRVGVVNIQVYSASSSGHADVLVADNDLRDFDTPSTAIPIEVTGSDRVQIRGNNIATVATRGISTGDCNDLAITANRMMDQTIYAVEMGGSHRVSITGNTAKGCKSFVQETLNPSFDVLIANNIYVGSGLSATAATAAIMFPNAAKRIRITGNIFTDWQHLTQGCVRIGSNDPVEDAVVEGNTFVITDTNTPLLAVQLRKCIRSSVARNTIRVERALVVGDDYSGPIHVVVDAASADLLVEYNDVLFTAAVASAPNAAGITNGNVGAGAVPGLTIRRNRVVRGPRGLRLVVNSTDMRVDNNETSTCTNADVIPSTAAIPATADVQSFAASGTWTKPIGSYSTVTVRCIGGGGGGASGRRGAAASVRAGGGGGGGAGMTTVTYPYASVPTTQTVTIGAGGAGGAAAAADDTNGTTGGSGGVTSWGTTGTAALSTYAAGGSGGGGGTAGAGPSGPGGLGDIVGGAGGAASGTGAAGGAGSPLATAGGGAGGGITSGNVSAAGGAGGTNRETLRVGGSAGAVDTGGSSPTFGSASPDPTTGSGGGGGGAYSASAAGAGGAGATWGGGGGGGGASLNGFPSGAGGAGGAGFCQVITA